jgi:hypothetical protein
MSFSVTKFRPGLVVVGAFVVAGAFHNVPPQMRFHRASEKVVDPPGHAPPPLPAPMTEGPAPAPGPMTVSPPLPGPMTVSFPLLGPATVPPAVPPLPPRRD